jgi:hypothetical protein
VSCAADVSIRGLPAHRLARLSVERHGWTSCFTDTFLDRLRKLGSHAARGCKAAARPVTTVARKIEERSSTYVWKVAAFV